MHSALNMKFILIHNQLFILFYLSNGDLCKRKVNLPAKIFETVRSNSSIDVDESVLSRRRRDDETTFQSCQECCCNRVSNRIDCSYSNLHSIPQNTHYMTHVYADYNQIEKLIIPNTDSSVDIETKPIELWVRHNKLTFIDFEEISRLTYLRLLVLQSNNINDTLPAKVDHKSLEILELPGNAFTRIANDTFTHMPNLRNLSLASNRIEWISKDAFIELTNLQELILRGNYMKSDGFTGLKDLKNLVKLDLSNNLIQVIKTAIFADLESLQILKLNGNKLTYLAPVSFYRLKKLEYLDLTENWLTTIDPGIFDPFKFTSTLIDVTTNPFICNCGIQGFLTWAQKNSPQLINGDKIQCMYGGESDEVRKQFTKTLYSLGGQQLCSNLADLKVAIIVPCAIFGILLLVVCITCIKRKIFSETKEMEEYQRNEVTRQAAEELGSIDGDDEHPGIPVSLMPQVHVNPDLMANRPEVMSAVRQQQLERQGVDPLHARIAATRGARDQVAATGYSSSAYGSEDEKPQQVQRPDLNARRRYSESGEDEPPSYGNFRGQGF